MAIRTRARRAAIAVAALVAAAPVTRAADDSGVHAFLSNLSGEAGRSAASMSAPGGGVPPRRVASDRSLTVRRQKPALTAAMVPTTSAKVTIYEDPTLRRGDAVMMADGIRVFAGSRSWPYAKADFVTLGEARDLNRDTVKVLISLNSLPRK